MRRLLALAVGAVLVLFSAPGRAVIVLDSTWRAEGGAKGREWAGFGAHLRLAAQPQFRAVVALASDGETWGEASGTWLGNDDRHAYILTSAHIYARPEKAAQYLVRSPGGRVLRADRLWVHPQWNGDTETRTGHDLVMLRLPAPLTDAGPPPLLYGGVAGGEDDGRNEAGQLITFVGFGSRGIGSVGQADRFYRGADKAAAQGVADQWVPLAKPLPRQGDGGNYLGVYLPREDGGVPNPYDGNTRPATPLVGLLGSGDSGGSAWMQWRGGRGEWVVVGVNSNGSGKAAYGDSSWFTRIAPHRDWVRGIFPGARFVTAP